ncbi:armadillo repeat-containing protein 6 homolog [Culicoides brevitarsis]|uniref:armadillo repeat-containing protein 6 homolog n=1 Tax=Culicoides brevitarsis TaxID=469753 RepID=UPI00307B1E35
MAKVVTQETYDEIIKENIVEFSMSVEEAREETIKQLEAQGINLGNIIKDLAINAETGVPLLNEYIEKLKFHTDGSSKLSSDDLINILTSFTAECNISVPHRVLAAKLDALSYVLKVIQDEISTGNSHDAKTVLHHAILAANSITHKNPDVFDKACLDTIIKCLDTQKDKQVICDTLKWIQKSCIMHEMNRQAVVEADILMTHLKPLLANEDEALVKEICAVFRYLILDDDVRVEFGKAHDHARLIATETLTDLTGLLAKFKDNESLVADLMLTIGALTVRNEFCEAVKEADGLKYVMDAMIQFPDSVKVVREALKLLKVLAGNDKVKVQIVQCGAVTVIASALSRFKSNETVAKAALVCISTLALRVKENADALFDTSIPESIIETMKIHPGSKLVQRNAAWAIRNMVSRSRNQCETWASHGVEDVLNAAMQAHPGIQGDVKAALRDLGLKVQLNEEWKGKSEKPIAND